MASLCISLLIGDFMEEIQRVWVAIYMYTAVMNESYNVIHAHYGFVDSSRVSYHNTMLLQVAMWVKESLK